MQLFPAITPSTRLHPPVTRLWIYARESLHPFMSLYLWISADHINPASSSWNLERHAYLPTNYSNRAVSETFGGRSQAFRRGTFPSKPFRDQKQQLRGRRAFDRSHVIARRLERHDDKPTARCRLSLKERCIFSKSIFVRTEIYLTFLFRVSKRTLNNYGNPRFSKQHVVHWLPYTRVIITKYILYKYTSNISCRLPDSPANQGITTTNSTV